MKKKNKNQQLQRSFSSVERYSSSTGEYMKEKNGKKTQNEKLVLQWISKSDTHQGKECFFLFQPASYAYIISRQIHPKYTRRGRRNNFSNFWINFKIAIFFFSSDRLRKLVTRQIIIYTQHNLANEMSKNILGKRLYVIGGS